METNKELCNGCGLAAEDIEAKPKGKKVFLEYFYGLRLCWKCENAFECCESCDGEGKDYYDKTGQTSCGWCEGRGAVKKWFYGKK